MIANPVRTMGLVLVFLLGFILSAVVGYLLALKFLFPMDQELRQESSWLDARRHGTDPATLRRARNFIDEEGHAFAEYEKSALELQLEILEQGTISTARRQRFCQTLKWTTCEQEHVETALNMLFPENE